MTDRSNRGNPRDRADYQGGQSRFAQRGFSHEERMHDDDSARRFPGRTGPDPRAQEGTYGSGGSYGYGGGFEHDGEPGYEARPQGDRGRGHEEFYESTGGFGRDVGGYGREGLGWPGASENRYGSPGTAGFRRAPQPPDDARKGYTQDSGYAQSGGERTESGRGRGPSGAAGYGPSRAHSDGHGHEGGGPGSARFEGRSAGGQPGRGRFYGRTPQGYQRSDERIREDVCDHLSHGHIDPSDISVKVEAGVVTLEGFIGSRHEKFHAEEVAESVLGVKDVENRLRVKRDGAEASSNQQQPARPANEATESNLDAGPANKGGRNVNRA